MLTGVARRIACALLSGFGILLVSSTVDRTPVIGSPQFCGTGVFIDRDAPVWSQFALYALLLAGGGAVIAAIALHAWSNRPVVGPRWRRTLMVAMITAPCVGALMLAQFLAWGTQGPIGQPQPILRFAAINGVISGLLLGLAYAAVDMAPSIRGRFGAFLAWGLGAAATMATVIVVMALAGDIDLELALRFHGSGVLILAVFAGLAATLKRPVSKAA